MMKQAGGAIAFRVGTKLNQQLARLRGKESVSIDEAKHILFEETQTALRKGNVEYSEALQKLADESGTNIKIENGKLKVETPLTAKGLSKTEQISGKEAVKLIERAKQSEPKITQDLQTVAKQTNGEIVGLDYRFKSEESLTRKIADNTLRDTKRKIKRGENQDIAFVKALNDNTLQINDALRYTVTFSPDNYVNGYLQTSKLLESKGYKLEQPPKNFWLDVNKPDDSGYRGINGTFISPGGQKFELQFHTPQSFKFKNDYHHLYEEIRLPETTKEKRRENRILQVKLSKSLTIPKNIDKIEKGK